MSNKNNQNHKKGKQLKRKMEETAEPGLPSKRRKNQVVIIVLLYLIVTYHEHSQSLLSLIVSQTLVEANVAEELFEIKAKLNNIENLLNNLTNELRMMKQHEMASSAIPPPPPPMQGLIQTKKLRTVEKPQFDGVLNEMKEFFK